MECLHVEITYALHLRRGGTRKKLFIMNINNYTYYIPFIEDDETIFLKNIIPSRKYHKIYKDKL